MEDLVEALPVVNFSLISNRHLDHLNSKLIQVYFFNLKSKIPNLPSHLVNDDDG